METSIPCKVYIKPHSLEKVSPRFTQDWLTVGASSGFPVCQVEAREGWAVGPQPPEDQSSNPHPARDRWVFMCKRRAPALTFRHCHEDEKRQPMKGEEPWHTPPGSEYTPASFRVVCRPEVAGGAHLSFPPRCAMWLYRWLFARGGRLVHTGSLTPTSNPVEKEET